MIFSHHGQYFTPSNTVTRHRGLWGLRKDLLWSKEGSEHLSVSHVLDHYILCSIQQKVHIFFSIPLIANVLWKTLLLLFTSLIHLNSSRILAFPILSLHAQAKFLYSSQTVCSFLFSPSIQSVCIPYSLVSAWLPAHHSGRGWGVELRGLSLKTSQLPWVPLLQISLR